MKTDLVKPIRIVEPGPLARAALEQRTSRRVFPLSELNDHPEKLCVWCNTTPLTGRKRRWCGDDCLETASMWAHPQGPGAKMWVLVHRQGGACPACGLDFTAEIDAMIQRKVDYNADWLRRWPLDIITGKPRDTDTRTTYHQIGYGTGETWHVDHIVPIHQGGRGFGLTNVQVICVPCHHKKTARERNPSVADIISEDPSRWLK